MARFDPCNHEKYYKTWKNAGMSLPGVTEENAIMIRKYIADMELGTNINPSSKKGSRSFGRLRNLKAKMQTMAIQMQTEIGINCFTELIDKEIAILTFFKKMRDGQILCRKKDGEPLRAVGTYCRAFKSFWHWYARVKRKEGIDIRDITIELDATSPKPKFCYFTIDQLRKLCDIAQYDYRVMMMFMFDSGIRAPTELMNVKASDLEWNNKKNQCILTIREETSKTFGRKIKLLLCADMLKGYIEDKKFQPNDYIFLHNPHRVNQYIKRLGYRILGIGTPTKKEIHGNKYCSIKDGLSMYDFRHSSACYWLPRYKSESAMKYRFGWKKSDMIFYYTELLGMRDNIDSEDLYIDITKTELEQELNQKGREIELLKDQMKELLDVVRAIQLDKEVEKVIVLQTPSSQ